MVTDYSMKLFFSRTMRWIQIPLALTFLCITSTETVISQELSPVTKQMFVAIDNGDLAQVKVSIANGANYKAVNTWGITPVDLAIDKGHLEIMHYLLQVIETQTAKIKLQPFPTSSAVPILKNSQTTSVETPPFVENRLSTVAEIYSPPPDAGPWSATVVTRGPPSNMKKAEVTTTDQGDKSTLKQIARNFPLTETLRSLTHNPREKPQVIEKEVNKINSGKKNLSTHKKTPKDNLSAIEHSKSFTRQPKRKKAQSVTFKIGRVTALDKAPMPETSTDSFYQSCINKNFGSLIFCIENLNWPDDIRRYFLTDSNNSKSTHTIVRYDKGAATYFHTLFPSKSYAQIINFFTQRYGTPTKKLERSIAPLAEKRRVNPSVTWQTISPTTKLLTTLEVRKYDDNRGNFPDTKRGAVYLYNEKSQTIFPHVSLVELMLLKAKEKS